MCTALWRVVVFIRVSDLVVSLIGSFVTHASTRGNLPYTSHYPATPSQLHRIYTKPYVTCHSSCGINIVYVHSKNGGI